MRRLAIGVLMLSAILMMAGGCATREWVREALRASDSKVDQRIARVDERTGKAAGRIDRVETQVAETAQRVEGMGFRMTGVETSAGEATQLAKGARGRADEAFTRADEVNARLTRLWSNRHNRSIVETMHVHFRINRADLDDGAQTGLLALVQEMKQNTNLSVDLEGYADPSGSLQHNLWLSQRRAEAVRLYLVAKGIELPRIQTIGRGPLTDRGTPDDRKRRVTVRLSVPVE